MLAMFAIHYSKLLMPIHSSWFQNTVVEQESILVKERFFILILLMKSLKNIISYLIFINVWKGGPPDTIFQRVSVPSPS